jgi:hypothetical protein
MKWEEYQRITKPLIEARANGYIDKKGGNGRRSTKAFGEDFFSKYENRLNTSMKGFYSSTNGYSYYWNGEIATRGANEKTTERGIINILPLEDLFESFNVVDIAERQKDNIIFYIKEEEEFSKTGQFIPVDYIEDICVGVFSKENNDEMMYFHDFGIGFYPLKLNFEGYVELVFAVRGYMMWPYVLIYLEYGKNDAAMFGKSRYDEFVEDMPLLFPDFKLEEFIALYESLKIT